MNLLQTQLLNAEYVYLCEKFFSKVINYKYSIIFGFRSYFLYPKINFFVLRLCFVNTDIVKMYFLN